MAEGLFNAMAPPGWRAGSAGTEPAAQVRPEAITVMREIGIDISGHRPKHLRDALGPDVALVIGLCQEEACPVVPGVSQRRVAATQSCRRHRPCSLPAIARRTAAADRRSDDEIADRKLTIANCQLKIGLIPFNPQSAI